MSYNRKFIIALVLNASLGTFFWMYTNTVFNSVSTYLRSHVFPDASNALFSSIASTPQLGAIPGSLLSGPFSQKYGRRYTMLILNIIAIIGILATLFANLPLMICGRFIQGVAFGGEFVITLMYCNEMSPLEIKGLTASITTLMYTLGVQVAFALGLLMPVNIADGREDMWRVLYGVALIPNVVRWVMLMAVFKFETPFLLMLRKQDDDAKKVLARMYVEEKRVEEEFRRLEKEINYLVNDSVKDQIKFKDLFTKKYRKCLLFCLYNAIAIAFSGTNNILLFSNYMISNTISDPNSQTPVIFTTILGNIDFFSCVIAVIVSNRIRRKPGLMLGYLLVGLLNLSYGILGVIDPMSPVLKYLLLVWPVIFEPFVGVMSTIYVSEASPDVLLSCVGVVNSLFGFLIAQFYLQMSEKIGDGGFQIIQGGILLAGVVITSLICVETMGKGKAAIIEEYANGISGQKYMEAPRETQRTEGPENKNSLVSTIRSNNEIIGPCEVGVPT